MRKIGVLIISVLFLISFVIAAEDLIPEDNAENFDANLPDTALKDQVNLSKATGIATKSNDVLAKEIVIPDNLKFFSKIIFGFTNSDPIDFQLLVVLIALLVFLILILHSILDVTPFFEGNKSWVGAIAATLLVSITGVLKSVSVIFFDLGNVFGVLEKWPVLKLGAAVIILFAIFYALNIILGIMKESMIIGKAVSDGVKAGAERARINAAAETQEALNG